MKTFVIEMEDGGVMKGELYPDIAPKTVENFEKLTRWAEVVEKKQGKPMNYVIMSENDFLYRKSVKDRFVMDILELDISDLFDPQKIIKE